MLTIAFGAVLQALNASTLAVALVSIRQDFHAGEAASWLISGLYLATAVGSPTAGRLADLFGPRRILFLSLLLVAVSSAAAPLAPDIGWLIAFRVLLGIGTCAAFPAGVAVLRAESDRAGVSLPASALSALTIAGQVMIALGPVLGGVLVQLWGWEAIFVVNLPLAALVAVMAYLWLPADRPRRTAASAGSAGLDLAGAGLFAAVITVLMLFLLSLRNQPQWWLLPLLIVLLVAFTGWELRAAQPFVDVRMLASNAALGVTYLRTGLTYVAFYTVFYGLPMWLESGRGLSPAQSGLIMLPIALCAMLSVIVTTRMVRRSGFRPVLVVGSAMLLAGGGAVMSLHAQSPVWALVLAAVVLGFPNGFNNLGNQTALYQQADASQAGIASGLYRTSQYVGANIAAAVLELCYAGPVSDAGLHRVGVVIVVISAVLVVGAVVQMARATRVRGDVGGSRRSGPVV